MGEGYKAKGPRLRTQASDVQKTSNFRKFFSVAVALVVRSVSVVRALGLVGRPAFVGRPAAVAFVGRSLGLAGAPGVGHPV